MKERKKKSTEFDEPVRLGQVVDQAPNRQQLGPISRMGPAASSRFQNNQTDSAATLGGHYIHYQPFTVTVMLRAVRASINET